MKINTLDRPPHMPSRIASWLMQEIVEGRLKPGDRLPTEQSLASGFGVSRNVVREAIARLRADGVVQSRQGLGAFVARPEGSPTLRFDAELMENASTFRNMFELRAILEIHASGLAAQRRTDEQLTAIGAELERMRGAEKWESGGVDADLAFHRAVAHATCNHQITLVVSFLSEQMRMSIMQTRATSGTLAEIVEVTIAEHQAIYDAIAAGSAKDARVAMARHVRNAAERLGCDLTLDEILKTDNRSGLEYGL